SESLQSGSCRAAALQGEPAAQGSLSASSRSVFENSTSMRRSAMTSKRLAFGWFTVLGLAIALTVSTAPRVVSDESHDRDHEGDHGRDDDSDDRVERGFKIAPVHLDLHDRNHELVGLGSYLVNAVGGCNDCHTCPSYAPGHDPYQGGDGKPNAAN